MIPREVFDLSIFISQIVAQEGGKLDGVVIKRCCLVEGQLQVKEGGELLEIWQGSGAGTVC